MSVKTSNAYGTITIDDEAIACATGHIARDCYGVVALVGQGSVKSKNILTKGIKIVTVGNRIYIDLSAILKYGVSIGTVTDNLKSAVKYGVEQFTGMIVDSVNMIVHVIHKLKAEKLLLTYTALYPLTVFGVEGSDHSNDYPVQKRRHNPVGKRITHGNFVYSLGNKLTYKTVMNNSCRGIVVVGNYPVKLCANKAIGALKGYEIVFKRLL